MKLLCIGEVNIDYQIRNSNPDVRHWNLANGRASCGGMVWNVALLLEKLGVEVLLFSPHGQKFREISSKQLKGKIEPFFKEGFQDNLCLELFDSRGIDYTVYLPFESHENYFKTLPEIVDHLSKNDIFLDSDNTSLFIGITDNSFDRIEMKKYVNDFTVFLTLSHVANYWKNSSIRDALAISEIIFLNYEELRVIESKIGKLSNEWFSNKLKYLIVTKGNNGADCCGKDLYLSFPLPIKEVKIQNIFGVGDAFSAGFIFAYLNGKSIEECMKYGQIVAYQKLLNAKRFQPENKQAPSGLILQTSKYPQF